MIIRHILCIVALLLCNHAYEIQYTTSEMGSDQITARDLQLTFSSSELTGAQLDAVHSCLNRSDASACYQIGQALASGSSVFGDRDIIQALQFFAVSCERYHAMACNAIGRAFYQGSASDGIVKSDRKALHYFNRSALLGHQGAMYNVGLILTNGNSDEQLSIDIIGSLECFKSSYLYGREDSLYYAMSTPDTTAAAKTAHEVVSDLIATNAHQIFNQHALLRLWNASSLLHLTDVDLGYISREYASTEAHSHDSMYRLWSEGVEALMSFDRMFRRKDGSVDDELLVVVEGVVAHLGDILRHYSSYLTKLQMHLVLDNLQDAVGTLAGRLDEYTHRAGELAEAMALSHYCRGKFAVWEADSACFNGAVSSAVSYYRRANDPVAAMRAFLLAQEHPYASTHWRHIVQTPRTLRASPWWDATSFRLTHLLQDMFAVDGGRAVQQQLDDLIALRAGSLRDVRTSDVTDAMNRSAALSDATHSSVGNGLRHIFTPFIGVREDNTQINRTKKKDRSTGGWAEFGPLFNGIEWSTYHCQVLPIVCSTLQRYIEDHSSDNELCGIHSSPSVVHSNTTSSNDHSQLRRTVELRCGSDTIVTVLRLRAGAHILPHCGTTNRRLIMHFVLRGAKGVEFRVGDGQHYGRDPVDEVQLEEDGSVQDTVAATDSNTVGFRIRRQTAYQPLFSDQVDSRGWVHSYGGLRGEDGLAIVFDDSFEHEVVHRGEQDRYVVLMVLKHPDVHYEELQ